MRKLEEFKLHWIEEPTSADDVLGHKMISEVRRAHWSLVEVLHHGAPIGRELQSVACASNLMP